MNPNNSSRILAGAALLALVLSLLGPMPAWADEGAPPIDPPASETVPPETTTDVAPGSAPGELPPAEGELTPTDTPAALPADVPPAADPSSMPDPAELLPLAPDGTTIAVVDAAGELLPLASEEAAAIIAAGDPVWCPASLSAPTPGLGGCTASFSSFATLLAALPAVVPADGIIWFEDSYVSGVNDLGTTVFTLNGATTFSALTPFKLTLRGGWDGITGSKLITGSSEFNARLQIFNWANTVTLSDLVFTGAPGGVASNALEITTTAAGSIQLTRVDSIDNTGNGARLSTSSGTGSVTVSDSEFNENHGNGGGLAILSAGKVTLANVTAGWIEDNGTSRGNTAGYGAYIDDSSFGGTGSVTLTGVNTFEGNWTTGVTIWTVGAITASNLDVNRNGASGTSGFGAELYNHVSPSAAAVTLTGTNVFNDNYGDGLYISSHGPIKLNNLIANANQTGTGVELYNSAAPLPQAVSLTGASQIKYNGGYGLYVDTNGAITLNNLTANGNGVDGARVFNNLGGITSDVKLTGTNAFHDNYNLGLHVTTRGAISAANLAATGNGMTALYGLGAILDNSSSISAKPVAVSGINLFSGNYNTGLSIQSKGAISLNSLTADDSPHGYGASISNNLASSAQKVTLTGTNTFRDNYNDGMYINSLGAISVNSLTASGNGAGAGGGVGANLYNASAPTAVAISLTGTNAFIGNDGSGLSVYSTGQVSLANVTASGNGVFGSGGYGAFVDNTSGSAGVTLSGTHVYNANYNAGLHIVTKGALSLGTTTASDNVHGSGVELNNTYASVGSPQNVTFNGPAVLDNNYYDGLSLSTYGTVTLKGLTAGGNGLSTSYGRGVAISNETGTLARAVTLNGINTFNDNLNNGLDITSLGAIKVNSLTASGNGDYGASLNNNGGVAAVTLTGSSLFEDNRLTGLGINSKGAVTLAALTSRSNGSLGGYAAAIDNSGSLTAQPIKIAGSILSEDNGYGLYVTSAGAISLASVTARGTTNGNGAQLANDFPGATAGVTLTGSSIFDDNYYTGLQITSYGPIAINTTRLEALGNGTAGSGFGAFLNNSGAATPMSISLKGVNTFRDNEMTGLYVTSMGAISLANVTAGGSNLTHGANVSNAVLGSTGAVTLSGVNTFSDNYGSGLFLSSNGPVTLNSLTATDNGLGGFGYGVYVNNASAATPQSVKLTGTNRLDDNDTNGLHVDSLGAISLASVTASGNLGGSGVYLINNYLGATGGVTLTGTNTFLDNYQNGLEVWSNGAVSLNNLMANDNGFGSPYGFGAYIYNAGAVTPLAIKITGTNTFNENYSGGLFAGSAGAISANNLTARNSANGSGVDFSTTAPGGLVSVTGTNFFSGNANTGLSISSAGDVTLSKVTSDVNGGYGLYVNTTGNVTLTCGSFTSNVSYGIYVTNAAVLKLIGVFAAGNGSADISTSGVGSMITVRLCP